MQMADTAASLLPQEAFAQAKARLSDLMDQAVHGHRVQVIDRHRGKEKAVLVSVDDLGVLLEGFEFHPRVSVSEGEFVVRLPELNLIAGGTTYEEALGGLVELAEQQAQNFLSRLDYYMQTDRRGQLGWLLKLALATPEERLSLFSSRPAGFWEAVRSGEPVERPVEMDGEEVVEHESWVIAVLAGELRMTPGEIEQLTEQAAVDLVHEHWSRARR